MGIRARDMASRKGRRIGEFYGKGAGAWFRAPRPLGEDQATPRVLWERLQPRSWGAAGGCLSDRG